MKLTTIVYCLVSIGAFTCPALASHHIPAAETQVVYESELFDGVSTGGWVKPMDPYDFFSVNVVAGSAYEFGIIRTGGGLSPGFAILDGIATAGQTVGDLGGVLVEDANPSNSEDRFITWSPEKDYAATVVISNKLEEIGDYKLTLRDPRTGVVPEPASVFTWLVLGGLAWLFAIRARKST